MHRTSKMECLIMVAVVVALIAAVAGPVEGGSATGMFLEKKLSTQSVKSGEGTFYNMLGNPTACGSVSQDTEMVAALSFADFGNDANPNNSPSCKKCATVNYGGKSVYVRIVDKCEACVSGDIDLTPAAFDVLVGDRSKGRVPIQMTLHDTCDSSRVGAQSSAVPPAPAPAPAAAAVAAAAPPATPQPQQKQPQISFTNNNSNNHSATTSTSTNMLLGQISRASHSIGGVSSSIAAVLAGATAVVVAIAAVAAA